MILFGSVAGIDRHRNWPGHPERPERLASVMAAVSAPEVAELLLPLEGRPARREELSRVHSERYLDTVAALSREGGGDLDGETRAAPGSWDTAVAAAGLGLTRPRRWPPAPGRPPSWPCDRPVTTPPPGGAWASAC